MNTASVLVVEDEAVTALEIRRTLVQLGYGITDLVASGDAALQSARTTHPDIILMDIRLSGELDGIETAIQLREQMDIPLVYLTAYTEDSTLRRAKETHPYGYVVKPFREKDLQTIVELALYKHGADKKLRDQEQWFDHLLTSINDGVIATDIHGMVTMLNPLAERLVGWSHADAVGRDVRDVLPGVYSDGGDGENVLTHILREGVTMGPTEHSLVTGDEGNVLPIEVRASPIENLAGLIVGSVLVVHDISERKQAEQQQQDTYDHLRDVSRRLEFAEEEERKCLARELHDELGQTLAAFTFDLAWLKRQMEAPSFAENGSALLAKIEAMSLNLKRAIQDLRRLVTSLRPIILDDLGLVAALEWQAQEFQARTGVRCDFSCHPDLANADFSLEPSMALYRMTQELLTNVLRHAQASQVGITILKEGGSVVLTVVDNGVGIPEPHLHHPQSMGLVGIRERAFFLDGEFTIHSQAKQGTQAIVRIPLTHPG